MPAPSLSATTTMFRVGSLSRSIGWTIKNLTPSRSGVFFVDQTVPTTFAKNIIQGPEAGGRRSAELFSLTSDLRPLSSSLRKNFRVLAHVARGGGDDRARAHVNLLAALYGAAHVVLADEVN